MTFRSKSDDIRTYRQKLASSIFCIERSVLGIFHWRVNEQIKRSNSAFERKSWNHNNWRTRQVKKSIFSSHFWAFLSHFWVFSESFSSFLGNFWVFFGDFWDFWVFFDDFFERFLRFFSSFLIKSEGKDFVVCASNSLDRQKWINSIIYASKGVNLSDETSNPNFEIQRVSMSGFAWKKPENKKKKAWKRRWFVLKDDIFTNSIAYFESPDNGVGITSF